MVFQRFQVLCNVLCKCCKNHLRVSKQNIYIVFMTYVEDRATFASLCFLCLISSSHPISHLSVFNVQLPSRLVADGPAALGYFEDC